MKTWATVAIAALLVGSAAAQTTAPCDCDGPVVCYENLDQCIGKWGPTVLANSLECLSLSPKNRIFVCLSETNGPCRSVNTCEPQVPAAYKCQCRKDIKCYLTLKDCRDQTHAVTPHVTDSNIDCEELIPERPFYSCWEEPHICRATRTCKYIPPGGGNQDPHFRGFDGSEYYFDGEPGFVYNIVTDTSINVNAQFVRLQTLKGTYMGRLGIRFGNSQLTFDPSFGLFFDGALLTQAEVELPTASFSISRTAEGRFVFKFQNDVWSFVATVAVEAGEKGEAYINLQASIIGDVQDPHGILGQTARFIVDGTEPRPDDFEVEGMEGDYVVADGVAGVDFHVNRFDGNVTAIPEQAIHVGGSRLRRATKSLFEAASE